VTWRNKFSRASGIGISGFSVTRELVPEKSRNFEMRRPHCNSVVVEDRCQRVDPRRSQRQVASGIGGSEIRRT
jgi:hypothetical protein